MKLSFSTLGCPRWTLKEIVATAKDLGFGGVEIRGIGDKINALEIPEFSDAEIEQTKEKIAQTGLVIPSLTSGATLAVRDRAQDSFLEACGYIDLARKLGVKYIRVMGTGEPHITVGDFTLGAGLYRQLCEYGAKRGVTPLIETATSRAQRPCSPFSTEPEATTAACSGMSTTRCASAVRARSRLLRLSAPM